MAFDPAMLAVELPQDYCSSVQISLKKLPYQCQDQKGRKISESSSLSLSQDRLWHSKVSSPQ